MTFQEQFNMMVDNDERSLYEIASSVGLHVNTLYKAKSDLSHTNVYSLLSLIETCGYRIQLVKKGSERMTDKEIYDLLIKKSENIKMHMKPEQVKEIADRFKYLSDAEYERATEQLKKILEVND